MENRIVPIGDSRSVNPHGIAALLGMAKEDPGPSRVAIGPGSWKRLPEFVESTHLTAKTHRGIPCFATRDAAAALPDRARRLQMLKDRAARREARNG